jgi:hypothetical protein
MTAPLEKARNWLEALEGNAGGRLLLDSCSKPSMG